MVPGISGGGICDRSHTHNAEYENRGLIRVFFAGDVTLATSVASTTPTPTPGTSHLRTYTSLRMESDKRYSLVKIEGVDDSKAASFYLGKKVAFVYRAKREVRGSNIRVIWGKVTRPHGTSTKSWTDCNKISNDLQATPALFAPSSAPTSPPRPSVPPFASCSTPPTSKRHFVSSGR
jgi:ribosomal protein L35AE/L33A